MLELIRRDGLARICKLETRHGTLETPALLPVVNPRFQAITPRELYETFGFKAIITNSYIIRNDLKMRETAVSSGLHAMLDYPGIIMTDSGTFQSHMYGEVEVKNEEIVDFQRSIGTDIGTVLDIFTEPEWSKERTAEAVEVTLDRTKEASTRKGEMMLAGVVQGSIYPDLRQHCAEQLRAIDVDVHPIGGVVPLMEQYRYADLVDVIIASKKGLAPERPVHLFGAGHPMVFSLAVLLGCDMFDSASYAKFAKDDRYMTIEGTYHLKDMKVLDCDCPACAGKTIETLKAMKPEQRFETIARHNLYASKMEMDRVKRAVLEGDIWELAEMRCRTHPALLDGLRRLKEHREFLERYEPLSRDSAMFYTGAETLNRPALLRFEQRVKERYTMPKTETMVVFEGGEKPYARHWAAQMGEILKLADSHFFVMSELGPLPIELDEIYPVAQSIFPRIRDRDMTEKLREEMEDLSHRHQYSLSCMYDGQVTCEMLGMMSKGPGRFDLDVARVHAVADHQFGKGAAAALFSGKVELIKSKNTDKIRNVLVDGEHVVSMRAEDGFFTLRPPGAIRLLNAIPAPRLRAVVLDDSVPFNREGKNVMSTFVVEADAELRPQDEVIVVDKNDSPVAIGRMVLTGDEIGRFKKGLAIKVREGIKPSA
ncbi:MAG: tRNA-guanine(15) transglycosylase [Methanomassiliicoccales archaeon PtaU1.Bin124]|nr:MAG: tRNA-guanine(15) transglycosylase [Methanomassiliicoccales archaeon PtaU1.Bin124]